MKAPAGTVQTTAFEFAGKALMEYEYILFGHAAVMTELVITPGVDGNLLPTDSERKPLVLQPEEALTLIVPLMKLGR